MLRRVAWALATPIRQAGGAGLSTKARTAIVGVEVDPQARANLVAMCGSILKGVQDLPADAGFRQQTERLFGYIKQVCEDPSIVDDADVEAKIGRGQLEEVLVTARNHLALIPKMREMKPWEISDKPLEISYWEVDKPPPPPAPPGAPAPPK